MSKNDLMISFEKQHEKIVTAAAKVGLYLYEFCKALKDMKESKLYLSAGYTSFEDYSLRALNIKKSQAYSYLKISDRYSPQFFQSNGKIGVTKLELLASLPEEEAQLFIDQNNIENLSVKQVKKTLASYQDKKDDSNFEDPFELEIIDVEIIEEDKTYLSFREFMKDKRLERGYSLRGLAAKIGHAHSYINNIEEGRRKPQKAIFYQKLSNVLSLSEAEEKEMYRVLENDFKSLNKLSPQVENYLLKNDSINQIIQSAINNNLTANKLKRILDILED